MNALVVLALSLAAPLAAVAADLPDPTRPAQAAIVVSPAPEPGAVGYSVSAIKIGDGMRLAIVNGGTVRVGDRLGAARVAGIETDGVVLETDERELKIPLFGAPVKKPAPR